jgi:hypothetical protein
MNLTVSIFYVRLRERGSAQAAAHLSPTRRPKRFRYGRVDRGRLPFA